MSKWTEFWDMHSGGSQKLDWHYIYIEAPREKAEIIFQNRFGRNPNRVTCTCCGEDYVIDESDGLAEATAFHRNCEWDEKKGKYIEKQERRKMEIRKQCNAPKNDSWGLYQTIKKFEKRDDVLIIRKKDIKPEEKEGGLKCEGYHWMGDD